MGVTTQFIEHDRVVGFRDTEPEQVRESEVTEAALPVFTNFVEQIARITPPTATMKETRQSCRTQLRRSERFFKPLDAVGRLLAPSPEPIPAALLKIDCAEGTTCNP